MAAPLKKTTVSRHWEKRLGIALRVALGLAGGLEQRVLDKLARRASPRAVVGVYFPSPRASSQARTYRSSVGTSESCQGPCCLSWPSVRRQKVFEVCRGSAAAL